MNWKRLAAMILLCLAVAGGGACRRREKAAQPSRTPYQPKAAPPTEVVPPGRPTIRPTIPM